MINFFEILKKMHNIPTKSTEAALFPSVHSSGDKTQPLKTADNEQLKTADDVVLKTRY